MAGLDHYGALGVLPDATDEQIQAAWKRRARELHPDLNKHKDATRQFAEVSNAHDILSDPVLRRRYDAERKLGTQSHGGPPPGNPNGWRPGASSRRGSADRGTPDWDYDPSASAHNFRDRWSEQESRGTRERERTPDWWDDLYGGPGGGREADRVRHDPFQGFVQHAMEQEELEDSYGRRFVFDRTGTPRMTREGVKNPFRTPFRRR
jgi:curved DNA-binding protein CbpA